MYICIAGNRPEAKAIIITVILTEGQGHSHLYAKRVVKLSGCLSNDI